MQGQLRRESLTVAFESECAHCSRSLEITIGSDLAYRVEKDAAGVLVFVPLVDFAKLRAKSIIDDF